MLKTFQSLGNINCKWKQLFDHIYGKIASSLFVLKKLRKHNQHYGVLFFTRNLHFGTSNYLQILKKNYLSSTIFTWSSFFWKSKEDSYRPNKVYQKFLYSVWKVTTQKVTTSKVATTKNSEHVFGTTGFDTCFLLHMITGIYFLEKLIVTLRFFSTTVFLLCLKCMIWKKPVFYLSSQYQ